jgi:uncharacterized protein (UPF0332 family)
MNSGGAGDASGATYNGSASKTISYNTIGAPSTTGTNASGNWGINVTGNAATATTATNANQLGGYNANNYAAFTKLNSFSVGGNTSNWYPVLFSGDYWGNGPLEIEFLRTSVHQDSSSYGYLYSKVRGHSTSWGHHGDFWEFENLIQSGTYAGFVNAAKALLLAEKQKTNHHAGIIDLFDTVFVETNTIPLATTFKELVYQIKDNEASEAFEKKYIEHATAFFATIEKYREKDLANA